MRFLSTLFICLYAVVSSILFYRYGILHGQSGHDTFQYIKWSYTLISDESTLIFYRPVLYAIMGLGGFLTNWHYAFMTSIYGILFAVSVLGTCWSCYKLKLNYMITLLITVGMFSSPFVVNSVIHNYTTLLEAVFIIAGLLLIYSNNQKSIFGSLMIGFIIFLSVHSHEEKILFWVILLCFSSVRANLQTLVVFLSFIIFTLITGLTLGATEIISNVMRIGGGVSSNWTRSDFLLIDHMYLITQSLEHALGGPLANILFLVLTIKIFFRSWTGNVKKREKFSISVILTTLIYFLVLVIVFGRIELYRIHVPVILAVAPFIFVFFDETINKLSLGLSSIIVTLGFIIIFLPNMSHQLTRVSTVEPSKELVAYRAIMRGWKAETGRNVVLLPSFESRGLMWGNTKGYSLQSVVYLGDEVRVAVHENKYEFLTSPETNDTVTLQGELDHGSDFCVNDPHETNVIYVADSTQLSVNEQKFIDCLSQRNDLQKVTVQNVIILGPKNA